METLTVLGLGNVLMTDDGVGVRLMEAVRDSRAWPASVEFVDGGAGGLNLLNLIESADRLVVFDAAEMHLGPGEHRVISPEQVRSETAGRISLHECPFIETWRLARDLFRAPPTALLAVQPFRVERGRGLSPELAAALPSLAGPAAELVRQWLGEAGARAD